ncbi:hypothetical protein [Brevibacillus sp. SKDU10]|uniref:hypothetical protein n=1 Tax=Brevibacillus sp. SKDU10 TaxID=1247872 RepID=UPI000A4576E0|nr:hypothetical protein [Brevibacillus sp. SKDU10]
MRIVDVKILNAYLKGLTTVLGSLGINIQRQDVQLQNSPYTYSQSHRVVSQITGDVTGDIIIGMEEDALRVLLQSFSIPLDMVDDEMRRSVLEEFADMVRGHAITSYQAIDAQVEFTNVGLLKNIYSGDTLPQQEQSLSVHILVNDEFPIHVDFVLEQIPA